MSSRRGATWSLLALLGALVWLVGRSAGRLLASWAFSTDDAFITLRYADHLRGGAGLVWNLGEAPIEGYSNFLFVLAAAGFGALGEPGVVPLKLLGCAGLVVTCALQWALARRWLAPLPALLPVALYTSQRGVLWWTVSGLETSVYTALVCAIVLAGLRGLGFERVPAQPAATWAGQRGAQRPQLLALAGGLGVLASLLRPEAPIVVAALALAVLAQLVLDDHRGSGDRRATTRGLAAMLLAFAPAWLMYMGWRLAYFGELVPNATQCKADFSRRFVLWRDYWRAAPVTLVFALLQPLRGLDARCLAPALIGMSYALILAGADPVVGHDLRHFLPAHALVCVLASVAGLRIFELLAPALPGQVRAAGLLAAVLALAGPLAGLPARGDLEHRAADYAERSRNRAALGRYLAHALPPGGQALLGDVGVAGWVAGAGLRDAFCLNDRSWQRAEIDGSVPRYVDTLLADPPARIVVHSREPEALVPRGAVYRELLGRPQFERDWVEERRFVAKSGHFHYFVFRLRGED